MSRLPTIVEVELDEPQRALWANVTGGARAASHKSSGGLVGPEGGLIGPFNAWLHSPAIGIRASDLGAAVRFESSLDPTARELTIVVVAAHWRSEFEYWAHRAYAVEAGVQPSLIDSIAAGGISDVASADERRLIDAARELLTTGRLSQDTFDSLLAQLGQRGVVDFVTTVGYYSLVSFNLNAFDVAIPAGAERAWPDAS